MKRKRSVEDERNKCAKSKRVRIGFKHNLLDLSDEILLRILSYLGVHQLIIVERVSKTLRRLATDHELWKSKFYDFWVYPRTRRIPFSKRVEGQESSDSFKLAKWLEHSQGLREGSPVDWKRQYKVRRNWAVGSARIHEVEVAQPPSPPALAKVQNGVIFTADMQGGLRAWSHQAGSVKLRTQTSLRTLSRPTSLGADSSKGQTHIMVGYHDGISEIYLYDGQEFHQRCQHPAASTDSITSVAIAAPYAATMSTSKNICIYIMAPELHPNTNRVILQTIATLHSETSYAGASLSLRRLPNRIIVAVAYAFSRLNAGWCLGLQEIRMTLAGNVLDSRLTSTIETPMDALYRNSSQWEMSTRSVASSIPLASFTLHPHLMSPPTSISYHHPYLVISLSDNTLMSYAVTSDDNKLEISTGRRLWGHTSAVSGAEVSSRGKAVSVSTKGEEIRVWELEDILTTVKKQGSSTRISSATGLGGLTAAIARRGSGIGLALQDMKEELAFTRRWVGFDNEQVIILGERDSMQIMSCYDFT